MKAIGTFGFLFKAYGLFLNAPNAKNHIHEVRTAVSMTRTAVPQKRLRNLNTRKKIWLQFSASTYFCNIWLVIKSVRNILRGENDNCSQWAELWFGILKADSNDLTTLNKSHSFQCTQPRLQFPHWNLAVTPGWLSPSTKSYHSSWQGAFKAFLRFFCFPFYQATQCHVVSSCQSTQYRPRAYSTT